MTLEALDYELIRQTITRYCHCLDFQDYDGVAACFTDDGYFQALSDQESLSGKHTGHAELKEFAQSVAEYCAGHVRHSSISVLIEGDGDIAHCSSYALITRDYGMPHGKNQTPFAGIVTTGMYVDELRKVDGKWLISKRTFRYDGYNDTMARVGKPVNIAQQFEVGISR
jgi:ketosteroid isomerase-like protein